MIELRWLKRNATLAESPMVKTTVRVLQFRTQVMQIGGGYRQVGAGDGSTYVAEYQRPMGMTWTDWQDVPEASPPDDILER